MSTDVFSEPVRELFYDWKSNKLRLLWIDGSGTEGFHKYNNKHIGLSGGTSSQTFYHQLSAFVSCESYMQNSY